MPTNKGLNLTGIRRGRSGLPEIAPLFPIGQIGKSQIKLKQ